MEEKTGYVIAIEIEKGKYLCLDVADTTPEQFIQWARSINCLDSLEELELLDLEDTKVKLEVLRLITESFVEPTINLTPK